MSLGQKKFLFVSVSLLLYAAACFIPSYSHCNVIRTEHVDDGWECIQFGIFTIDWIKDYKNPFPFISWLSNLPFLIGLVVLLFSRRYRGFTIASFLLFISLIMSMGALICYGDPDWAFFPGPGCIVWIFSQFMLFTGAFILKKEFSLKRK